NIPISPDGASRVGPSHTFTCHVHINGANAPANTPVTFTIDLGPGSFSGPSSCDTVGATGSCTVAITSAVTGVTTVSAHVSINAGGGVTVVRNTDGTGSNSAAANKTWVNAKIAIAPDATNRVGSPHTFTVTVSK